MISRKAALWLLNISVAFAGLIGILLGIGLRNPWVIIVTVVACVLIWIAIYFVVIKWMLGIFERFLNQGK